MAGGRWTEQLPPATRQNLRWFWLDGVFANASDAIIQTYLTLFVLALGANSVQIGLMNSLSNLGGAIFLLPGAWLVERWGHRRQIVVANGGGLARLMLLLLALLPLVLMGPVAVTVAIVLVVVRGVSGSFSYPAWLSLSADIVPMEWRGRYFASRNIMMSVAGMVTVFLSGLIVTRFGELPGYQYVLGLTFVLGLVSTYSYNRIADPLGSAPPPEVPRPARSLSRHLREDSDFWILCATAALWNFSLNIAGPFFRVYLVQDLSASATMVAVLSVAYTLSALPGQRLFGMLADKWGPRRVVLLTGLFIPGLPIGWALVTSAWQLIPLELISGFLWAGYNLAIFNYLLVLIPEGRRERYSAFYQIVVMVASAVGSALGGVMAAGTLGFVGVFIISGIGRLVAALVFAASSRKMPHTAASAS